MNCLRLKTCVVFLVFAAFSSPLIAEHPLDGIWEQKLLVAGQWKIGGIFEFVSGANKELGMNIIVQPLDPTLINSQGLSNVRSVSDVWTFDSDWGRFGIGNFQLKRDSADRYVGHAYQDGKQNSTNEWVRVATLENKDVYASNGNTVTTYWARDRTIAAYTFEVGETAFVASTTTRVDDGLVTLKCVIVEPVRKSEKKKKVTAHWSIAKGKANEQPTGYYLDPTTLSLTRDEMESMQRLLESALESHP